MHIISATVNQDSTACQRYLANGAYSPVWHAYEYHEQ